MLTPTIPLILASSSPRRIDLLQQAGLTPEVCPPLSQEIIHPGEKPQQVVKRLSREKAFSIRNKFADQYTTSVLLAADTIVVTDSADNQADHILGKPKTTLEAKEMLMLLEGKTHSVWTGYCLIFLQKGKKDQQINRALQSRVTLRALSPEAIDRYILSGEPMDKAGGYGAQGLGMTLIEKISGSYSNVVGLPITQVLIDLENLGAFEFLSWINPISHAFQSNSTSSKQGSKVHG